MNLSKNVTNHVYACKNSSILLDVILTKGTCMQFVHFGVNSRSKDSKFVIKYKQKQNDIFYNVKLWWKCFSYFFAYYIGHLIKIENILYKIGESFKFSVFSKK